MDIYGYVYLVRNKVNGKVYVGQTTKPLKRRWVQHKSIARRGKGGKLHGALRKYGEEAFQCVELHRAFSQEELDEMEIRSIWSHASINSDCGYNLTFGGDGMRPTDAIRAKLRANNAMTGRQHTEETRQKMRESHAKNPSRKGIPMHSDEFKKAISLQNTGRGHSLEVRIRMSASRTGSTRSEEAKQKTAAKHRGTTRSAEARMNMSLGRQRKKEERQKAEQLALAERTN